MSVVISVPVVVRVNAAFFREIKDSSLDHQQTADQIESLCKGPPMDFRTLRRYTELSELWRDQLAVYFSLEDTYGYIELPIDAPEALERENAVESVDAIRLRQQHASLYLEVSGLVEFAEELQYRGLSADGRDDLLQRTLGFSLRLDRHERQERRLIRC